ncbi:MAG: MFS transporter, partial [Cardiobacterium sp.]
AISAACFVPLLFNGILAIYPPRRRGTAMGVITMMFTVAPAIGPTISGLIIDHSHWRVLFAFTVPFILAAMLLVGKYLTVNLSSISRPKIDLPSAILSVAGFGGLVYACSNFAHLNATTFAALALGALLLIALFARRQHRIDVPLLNLLAVSVSACITGETHGLNALPKALNPHGAAIIATLNPIAGAIGAAYFIGATNIGEKLTTAATAQQTMLGGIRLAVGSALILAATTIWLASKLQPNRAESPQPQEPKT